MRRELTALALCPFYPPKSGHLQCTNACLLCANSGHCAIYSITLSARARSGGGTVRPSALAVLRLTIISYFVGC